MNARWKKASDFRVLSQLPKCMDAILPRSETNPSYCVTSFIVNVIGFLSAKNILRGELFSMLCNMRSKLIPTDHIYIRKYRNF